MKTASFRVRSDDLTRIESIADRFIVSNPEYSLDQMSVEMDIAATHANGCPLDLAGLLAAGDFGFSHDLWGIRRHINRWTGQLENCFLPRFALKENAK